MKNAVQKGSLISFYGTKYTVDSVEEDRAKVTMGNGIQITLWWTEREGCTLIKF